MIFRNQKNQIILVSTEKGKSSDQTKFKEILYFFKVLPAKTEII